MRAQFVLQEIWIGLRRNLTMTVAVIVTVAISLALVGTGLLIRQQVNGMKDYWSDKIEVSVFLCVKTSSSQACRNNGGVTTETQRQQIKHQLESLPQVEKVYYESQQQAYTRFKERFKSVPAFWQSTRQEDIPDSFRVKLKNPRDYQVVASAVQGAPGVDSVLDEQQVLDKFFRLLNRLRDAAFAIAVIQFVAAVLLIGNTIRLSAYNRRRETGIMRLVGASNFYIQLPFLMEGAIAGLIGGLIAAALLVVAKIKLFDNLSSDFTFATALSWGAVFQVIVVSLVIGVLLCAVASFVTLRRYLRV